MPLKLYVPAIEEKPVIPAETRPKKVQEMISSLSISNASESAADLIDALSLLNRQKVGADNRLKLLEILRPAVIDATRRLAVQFCGIGLPLPVKAIESAGLAQQLTTELAYGYKQAVLEQENRLFSFGGRKQLALAIHRAILALDQILLISYQTYTQPPSGIWSELHQLYLHAAQDLLQSIELEDGSKTTSIDFAYKRTLLMALANPGQLSAIEVERLSDYLDRYSNHAQIQALGKPENTSGIFLVRLRSDIAAIPLAKNHETLDLRTDILLITIDLARLLHNQINMLQSHEPPRNLGLPDAATDHRYQDLLKHLLKQWGNPPKRAFARLDKNDKINVTVGLAATQYFLNDESPYVVTATVGDHEAQKSTLNFADAPNTETFSSACWMVVNESAGGLALGYAPGVQNSVRVGDLLGLRSDQAQHWGIGAVRRVSVNSTNTLEIGIQMLAPTAKPCAVRPIDRKEFEVALMLPELSALKQPPSLITPRGIYQPARVLDIDQNGTLIRVMATKLMERTNSFERFQYSHFDR